jgi:hypothetical protein
MRATSPSRGEVMCMPPLHLSLNGRGRRPKGGR